MWRWYDLLPKDGSVTDINVIAVVSFVSIKATNVGDRLLAASFITVHLRRSKSFRNPFYW